MAAIFDDDGFLIVALHVRQRLGENLGLLLGADRAVGHHPIPENGGFALTDPGPMRKVLRMIRKSAKRFSEKIMRKKNLTSAGDQAGERQQQPGSDQDRAAGGRSHRKQGVKVGRP